MSCTEKATRASAPLANYIRKALPPNFNDGIFSASPHLAVPILVKGKTNRILTYRGCFNPPHQGHIDALCHAFFRSGANLNIIAAIIYLLPSGSLAVKHKDENSIPLLLTEEERISIINNSGIEGGWHWCYPRHIDEQDDFEALLQEEAEKDGFEIDFITLTGPDHVSDLKPGRYWDRNTIVSGAGQPPRTNFRAGNTTGLSKVGGYTEWKNRPVDEKLLDELSGGGNDEWIRQKMIMLAPQNYDQLPPSGKVSSKATTKFKKDLRDLEPVRSCKQPSKSFLRYVPTRPFGNRSNSSDVSSTKIRQVMDQSVIDPAVLYKLAGSALLNETLFKTLLRHQDLMTKAQKLSPENLELQIHIYTAATRSDKVIPKLMERQLQRVLKDVLEHLDNGAKEKATKKTKEQEDRLSNRRHRVLKAFEAAMARQRKNYDEAKERQRQAWEKDYRRRQLWHKTGMNHIQEERSRQLRILLRGATDAMRQYVGNTNDNSDRMFIEMCDEAERTMKQKIEDCTEARSQTLDDYFKWESTVMRHRLETKLEHAVEGLDAYIKCCEKSMADWLSHVIEFSEENKEAMLAIPNSNFERRMLEGREIDNPSHRHQALLEAWKEEADERQRQAIEVHKAKERKQQRKAKELRKAKEREQERQRRAIERQNVKDREQQRKAIEVQMAHERKRKFVDDEEAEERQTDRMDIDEIEYDERPAKRTKLAAPAPADPSSDSSSSSSSSSASSSSSSSSLTNPRPPLRAGHGFGFERQRTKYAPKKSTGGRAPRHLLASKAAPRARPNNRTRRGLAEQGWKR